ncbi:MAG: hypothetical protein AAGA54_02950 [Myxococcota bacterium]
MTVTGGTRRSRRRWLSATALILLACGKDPEPPPTVVVPPSPTPELALSTPAGFTTMESSLLHRFTPAGTHHRFQSARGVVAPGGATEGFIVAVNASTGDAAVHYGASLDTLVDRALLAEQRGLEAAGASAPEVAREPEPRSVLTRSSLPLPDGGVLELRTRWWADASGALLQASCRCAGTGCGYPSACTLPEAPDTAPLREAPLGAEVEARHLTTPSGSGRMDVSPHATVMTPQMEDKLRSSKGRNPHRRVVRIQGAKHGDAAAALLAEAVWCEDDGPCQAKALADRMRTVEAARRKADGSLAGVRARNDPHATPPTFTVEFDEARGGWTRTTLWNDGPLVREITCECLGLACALAR